MTQPIQIYSQTASYSDVQRSQQWVNRVLKEEQTFGKELGAPISKSTSRQKQGNFRYCDKVVRNDSTPFRETLHSSLAYSFNKTDNDLQRNYGSGYTSVDLHNKYSNRFQVHDNNRPGSSIHQRNQDTQVNIVRKKNNTRIPSGKSSKISKHSKAESLKSNLKETKQYNQKLTNEINQLKNYLNIFIQD